MERKILVRTRGSLPLTVTPAPSYDKMKKSINTAFKKWYDSMKKVAFTLHQSDYVLDGSCGPKETLSSLYKFIKDSDYSEIEGLQMSAATKATMFEKLFAKRLKELSTIYLTFNVDENNDDGDKPDKVTDENKPKIVNIDYTSEKEYKFTIDIDLLGEFAEDTGLKGLPKVLTSSLRQQIEEMRSCVQNFFDSDTSNIHVPKAYHFRLKDHSTNLLTLIYPNSLSDSQLTEYRKKLHEKLALPLDRPYIRKANALKLDENSYMNRYLICPHTAVPSSGKVNSGKVVTVQGNYFYHHYTQDGYNDVGWGCAYRSLQTIISWFMLQGYLEIDRVPTHKEIQEALVACGDKEPNFVGKEKWIGSQEVSYVLSQLYDISSKIMFVNSGRELGSKGSELKHHFETNGTPIMIGGGVLAHTILGIDFDENSGQLMFLVLDPHYTGPEDLTTIVKKGWCNWKSPDFWEASSFYNLCMPQKPQTF